MKKIYALLPVLAVLLFQFMGIAQCTAPVTDSIPDYNYCNGTVTMPIAFTSATPGATFTWTSTVNLGFGTSGNDSIPSFTANNNGFGASPIIATVTVSASANGCTGSPVSFTITINPTPQLDIIRSSSFCNGQVSNGINFNSFTPGATITWMSDLDVGFGTSGSGSIPSFTAVNTGVSPVTATLTITPSINGCTGRSTTTYVFVDPVPMPIISAHDSVYCNGETVPSISIGATGPIITYSWFFDTNIGLPIPGTISAPIPSFTATNKGTTPVTATVSVTVFSQTCPVNGNSSFTLTVNPTPVTDVVENYTYCSGSAAPPISFTSATPGATFTWASTADVGFGTNGSGSIPSFTAINTATTPVTATVTVYVSANGCSGSNISFTITVQPAPAVSIQTSADTVCRGQSVTLTATGADVYNWQPDSLAGSSIVVTPATITTYIVTGTNGDTGCSDTASFTLVVNPVPSFASTRDTTICSESVFTYTATSVGADDTFSWFRPAVPGVSSSADSGTGATLSETLVNTTHQPVTVSYIFTVVSSAGCTCTDTVRVTVNPADSCSILPVTLLYFSGKKEGNNAHVWWQTANENNLSGFAVQRSRDGVHFTTLGNVNATAGNAGGAKYSYTDTGINVLAAGKLYYRLLITGADGKTTTSTSVVFDIPVGNLQLYVTPNPVENTITVYSPVSLANALVCVIDVAGHQLYTAQKTVPAGGIITIDASRFAKGIYWVSIKNGAINQVIKVMK